MAKLEPKNSGNFLWTWRSFLWSLIPFHSVGKFLPSAVQTVVYTTLAQTAAAIHYNANDTCTTEILYK